MYTQNDKPKSGYRLTRLAAPTSQSGSTVTFKSRTTGHAIRTGSCSRQSVDVNRDHGPLAPYPANMKLSRNNNRKCYSCQDRDWLHRQAVNSCCHSVNNSRSTGPEDLQLTLSVTRYRLSLTTFTLCRRYLILVKPTRPSEGISALVTPNFRASKMCLCVTLDIAHCTIPHKLSFSSGRTLR